MLFILPRLIIRKIAKKYTEKRKKRESIHYVTKKKKSQTQKKATRKELRGEKRYKKKGIENNEMAEVLSHQYLHWI